MDRIVVYFHGFESSTKSDKIERLRQGVPNASVLAFPIDQDPSISLPFLTQQITESLGEYQRQGTSIVFVGTSLGAWFASTLARQFAVPAVLVNPSYDPKLSLQKYGLPDSVLVHYSNLFWDPNFNYYISLDDEVIDFRSIIDQLKALPKMHLYERTSHRFNGPEFDDAIAKVNEIIRHARVLCTVERPSAA